MNSPVNDLLRRFRRPRGEPPGNAAEVLRRHAEPLPARDSPEFGELFDRFGDASVVLIGEASHGTQDFYQTRAAITRRLIEQHGFGIVAVEADWPDAGQIDRCVRDLGRSAWKKQAFSRFPTWMWRNTSVQTFTRWLHHHNRGLTPEQRVEFRGLDVYSMRHSIDEVLGYLDKTDPQLAKEARHRYSCLTPWNDDPALYGHFAERGNMATCEDAVVEQLNVLLGERLDPMVADDEAFFSATQNARVVRAAEQYYRAMYRGSTASWNLRDLHMFETLQTLMEHRGAGAKAVVWAHNSHIGNAAATQMGWEGQFNIGQLCRTAYGSQAVLIGMGTDHGTVAAADDWDEPMQVKQVNPALADSWEQLFLQAGVPAALLDWRTSPSDELLDVLAEPLLERAIGVIYRPRTERQSHYFQAVLAEQFDAFVWIEKTHAVSPLPEPEFMEHEEDTFPFGI
ncbi:erythromycin esterase family protein [Pseudomonas lini]|uniref:Carboxylic ester hydrolase n=1 Tax=Pseudomonas lini TaxID=163011 RepID=A0A423IQA8_9PSED|nr:erythromycin esterase family protein [Pseudomonas lini]RON27638.1 carboxylic ester hydrolase [Pseudomonas lini]